MSTRPGSRRTMHLSSIALLLSLLPAVALAQSANAGSASKTQVVMLGTGTPGFDIDRSGPATTIVVNGTAYLVDFGAGVMRRDLDIY